MSGFLAMDESSAILDERCGLQGGDDSSLRSGRYGVQYSDSDGDLPGDDDDEEDDDNDPRPSVPNMWDSWGVLKNISSAPVSRKHEEDIELNSLHSNDDTFQPGEDTGSLLQPHSANPRRESFDLVDDRKFYSEDRSEVEDDSSLQTYETEGGSHLQRMIHVAQDPVDEDMHRAWETHLEDLHDTDLDTLAGWYGDAPTVPLLVHSLTHDP
jgi:hypothetical protein